MRRVSKETIADKLIDSVTKQAVDAVKDLPVKLVKTLIKRFTFSLTIPEESETYFAFEEWFYKNYEDKFRDVTVYNFSKDSDGEKKKRSDRPSSNHHSWRGSNDDSDFGFGIGYSQNTGKTKIKYQGTAITISKVRQAGDKEQNKKAIQLYVLSGSNKQKIKQLVEEVYAEYNSSHDQIKVFVSDLYGGWNMVKRISGKPIDGIILNSDIHSKLVRDLEEFSQDKDWYDKLNIPYKRGYLLYGPPGNGKTSLSIAIASKHHRNIYCLDINKLRDDQTLRYAFQSLEPNSLLLIEDIDAAFDRRETTTRETSNGKKSPSHSITFACLLNCLDGVYYKDGLVTILTTNHLTKLDEALIRPGRMDMRVHVDNPTITEVEAYMSRFFSAKITLSRYVQQLSMAQVQGVCITHRKDVTAAIAEIESDAISVVLNDTVEMLELIAERDKKAGEAAKTSTMAELLVQLGSAGNLKTMKVLMENASITGTTTDTEEVEDDENTEDEELDDMDNSEEYEPDDSLPSSADGIH